MRASRSPWSRFTPGLAVTSTHKVERDFGGMPPPVEVAPHKMRTGRCQVMWTWRRRQRLCGVTWVFVAPPAVQDQAQVSAAPFLGAHPRPQLPRGPVPNMLAVAARQLGHPVALFVLVEAGDGALHLPAIPHRAADAQPHLPQEAVRGDRDDVQVARAR